LIVLQKIFSEMSTTEMNWTKQVFKSFYVPLDTKQVISETFFPANLLAWYWKKTKPNNQQLLNQNER